MLLTAIFAIAIAAPDSHGDPTPTVRYQKRSYSPLFFGGLWAGHNNNQTFDEFTLDKAERITGLEWDGVYVDSSRWHVPVPANTETWEVSIWSDVAGKPDEQLFFETQPAGDVETTDLGLHPTYPPEQHYFYQFKMTFVSGSFEPVPGETYWLSVRSISPGSGQYGYATVAGVEDGLGFSPMGMMEPNLGLKCVQLYRNSGNYNDRSSDRNMRLLGVPLDDSDGDGMRDDWEEANRLNVGVDDASLDPDEDGSPNWREFELSSDPQVADTDGDGLPDGVETDTRNYTDETDTGTSPTLADTDGDGLSDRVETNGGVYVSESDTGTDPTRADSDADGYFDGIELRNGYDPLDRSSFQAPTVLSGLRGGDLSDPDEDGDPSTGEGFDVPIAAWDGPVWGAGRAGSLFDNTIGETGSGWLNIAAKPNPWVTVTLGEPHLIEAFTLTSDNNVNHDPDWWEIQGSHDGVRFETIYNYDLYRNRGPSAWTGRRQTLEFKAGVHYHEPEAYRVIRFWARHTVQDQFFDLEEIELFGSPEKFEISNVDVLADGSVRLRWKSRPGERFAVEGSSDLKSWEELDDDVRGSDGVTEFVVQYESSQPGREYFRVVRFFDGL